MQASMQTREIHMLYTSKKGETHTQSHFVWDSERFVQSQQDEAKKQGGKAEQITKEQYDKLNPKRAK